MSERRIIVTERQLREGFVQRKQSGALVTYYFCDPIEIEDGRFSCINPSRGECPDLAIGSLEFEPPKTIKEIVNEFLKERLVR